MNEADADYDEEEPDEDSEFCHGCNPEPTMEEQDCGICASCGKALA
jgi:hypothetical protein